MLQSVDARFFKTLHETKGGQLNFKDYYAIVIWPRDPGIEWASLQPDITSVLKKNSLCCAWILIAFRASFEPFE